MSVILCDESGDWLIQNNKLSLTDGLQETLQLVRNTLRTNLGEEPLNQLIGVPYFTQIMEKGIKKEDAEAILREVIEGVPGVVEVVNIGLSIDKETRDAALSFQARSLSGLFNDTVEFP